MKITQLAPAKINLMLHVVGRLPDGYHHLQSLVSFGPVGDLISVERAKASSLTVSGPFLDQVPMAGENTVVLAAKWLKERFPNMSQAHIHLEKNLPVAAGIGGGTSDAAATIIALLKLNEISLSFDEGDDLIVASGTLGADVPLSLAQQFGRGPLLWIEGSGRETIPQPVLYPLLGTMLLVNPGVALSTPLIFKKICPPYTSSQDFIKVLEEEFQGDLVAYLNAQRNDLTAPAVEQEPVINEILTTLQNTSGCLLARMSGSGATCFGLFKDKTSAQMARHSLNSTNPTWWTALPI